MHHCNSLGSLVKISIDNSMVLYFGHHNFKIFIKKKPITFPTNFCTCVHLLAIYTSCGKSLYGNDGTFLVWLMQENKSRATGTARDNRLLSQIRSRKLNMGHIRNKNHSGKKDGEM